MRPRPFTKTWIVRLVGFGFGCAAFLGCVSAPRIIPLPVASEAIRPSAANLKDYPEAIAAIVSILTGDLGLPAPEGTVTLYPNGMTLEAALLVEMQKDSELIEAQLEPKAREKFRVGRDERLALQARQLATTSSAIAMHKRIFVNELLFFRYPWYERVRFLAHEMAHVVERGTSNGRPTSAARWMQEGFAEWVAYKVQEAIDIETFAKARERSVDTIAKAKVFQTFPSLTQLNTGEDWLTWVRTLGLAATYAQAFLAVDFWIEQSGLSPVVEYFRLFNKLNNRERNFTVASGDTIKTFEEKFDNHLKSLIGRK